VTLTVQLLGRPRLIASTGDTYRFRSRKSWALLTYLVLAEHPPSRGRLAGLLFGEADDPGRALRWGLAEIRRGLGDGGALDGDPVVLRLAEGSVVDVDVLLHRPWAEAVGLPGLGAELLEGVDVHEAAGFETWLLAQQRRVAAASEAVLHEAALGFLSRGELAAALGHAVRAAAMNPLDENHQALVVRLYRLMGDDEAAARQYELCRDMFARELGVAPGPALRAALRERGIGRLTIKKRGVAVAPEQLRSRLALRGDAEATLVLTRVAGKGTALLVRPFA
jgi:DNA-binding SARP family transcriptional activator